MLAISIAQNNQRNQSLFSLLYYFYFLIFQYVKELLIPNMYSVENIGVEPMTSCVQGRRSSQLS